MKKVLLLIFMVAQVQAYFICSSSIQDGGPTKITSLELKAQKQLSTVSASWKLIEEISSKIKKQSQQKKQHLQNIYNLTKANNIKEQKIKFEYIRYKKLLGVYNDMIGSVSNER